VWRILVLVIVVLALSAIVTCRLAAEQAVQAAITSWLECDECTDGELDTVIRLGHISVTDDLVVRHLGEALRGGPSADSQEALTASLKAAYQDLSAFARDHPEMPVSISEDDYVRAYVSNYIALYQVRSATALAKIGTENAMLEITRARTREDLRSDVRRSLEQLQ